MIDQIGTQHQQGLVEVLEKALTGFVVLLNEHITELIEEELTASQVQHVRITWICIGDKLIYFLLDRIDADFGFVILVAERTP
ncbi:hypothetical protein D9M70_209420 [compost metagenome]